MKFFEKDNKYNWVDENNLFVGFVSEKSCCADFGFFYTQDRPDYTKSIDEQNEIEINKIDLHPYVFSGDFYEWYLGPELGEAVSFRLVNKEGEFIYLTIYNSHNGYYGHGFEFCNGENVIIDGIL